MASIPQEIIDQRAAEYLRAKAERESARADRAERARALLYPAGQSIEIGARRHLDVPDGYVIVASDAHYWPGEATTAQRALVHFARDLCPRAVIMNGDLLDGASISRFSPGSQTEFTMRPTVTEEIAALTARLREIEDAAGNAERFWTFGNHDARFETFLLKVAPEFSGVFGTRLKDHFPRWTPCWSLWINPEGPAPAVIKHRFGGGIHAAYQNTLKSGMTILTGHLHSLNIRAHTDYRGTRWGVDTGTLAVPQSAQFIHYTEDNPVNWRSGFVVLSFANGRLLWPELAYVIDEAAGLVGWRGGILEV